MSEHINSEEVLEQLIEIESRWIGENRDTITNIINLIHQQQWKILRQKKLLKHISEITDSRVIKAMIDQHPDD